MDNRIITLTYSITGNFIFQKQYNQYTNINKIKLDLLEIIPFSDVSLLYNDEIIENTLIMYISNDTEICLSVIVNQLSKYKQYNGDFIIKYITESKCIIYSIDTFPKYSYTCELNILKITNIDKNNILILTTDNKLYSLKIKNNIFKLIYKKKILKIYFMINIHIKK